MAWAPAEALAESWVVEWNGEVEAQRGHGDVDAEAEAYAHGDLFLESVPSELAVGVEGGGVDDPDVSYVGEEGALEDACDGEALLEVDDELEVADAFEA